jgi:hypothetical protein
MSNNPTSQILACPVCGEPTFSWMIHQVQFGTVHDFDGRYDGEATKQGPVTDTDLETHGVFCVNCQDDRELDELVPYEEDTE